MGSAITATNELKLVNARIFTVGNVKMACQEITSVRMNLRIASIATSPLKTAIASRVG